GNRRSAGEGSPSSERDAMSASTRLYLYSAAVLCAAAVLVSAPAHAVTIVGVRTGDDPARTRLVFDLDGPAPPGAALGRKSPTDWIVDLPSCALGSAVSTRIES